MTVKEADHNSSPVTWTRTLVAFSSLGAALVYIFVEDGWPEWRFDFEALMVWGFLGALVASPFILRLRSMAAQIFGRAVLVQALFFCAMALINALLIRQGSLEPAFEITAALAAVTWPLIVIGKRGLETVSRHFAPNAFRTTIIASLLLGLADAWALAFYTAVTSEVGAMLICAGVMGVAIFGLFRMKVWGLALCILANIAIAGLALSSTFELPAVLSWGLVATAAVQLMLPVPLVLAMRRGAKKSPAQTSVP